MKHRFNKKEIPFLSETLNKPSRGRDYYWLARKMQESDYYTYHNNRYLYALSIGASIGDNWAMHELGKALIKDDERLPEGLSYYYKAITSGNTGAKDDLFKQWDYVYHKVMGYRTKAEAYADIEVKCALLTSMLLIHFGASEWNTLSYHDKTYRIQDLVNNVCDILKIKRIKMDFKDILGNPPNEQIQGLAYFGEYRIEIANYVLENYERLIQVIFHEIGHHIVWAMRTTSGLEQEMLFDLFGLNQNRIPKWEKDEKGYEITLNEEDPDTFSYGVWWTYLLYFPIARI